MLSSGEDVREAEEEEEHSGRAGGGWMGRRRRWERVAERLQAQGGSMEVSGLPH